MPTLVWIRRPECGTSGAGGDGASNGRREKTVPESVVSAVSAVDVVSPTDGDKKKKRMTNGAKAATVAKKRSKATREQELPTGVNKLPCRRFKSYTWFGGKSRYVGTFDTPEQASAAYNSVRKNLDDAKLSMIGADEVDATFDEAQKKAVEEVGGVFPKKMKAKSKRCLPRGVVKLPNGKFRSSIRWGGKQRCIGTFDDPQQASAAHESVREGLEDANLSALGADEVIAIFDGTRKKALESFGGFVPEKRDVPRGVYKAFGRFQTKIYWHNKLRHIGAFDSSEQASAAYASVRKDIDNANPLALGADEVDAVFDAARRKAFEKTNAMMDRLGAETRSAKVTCTYRKFESKYVAQSARIRWGGKRRYIGTFDTPEQTSAARMSVRKDLDEATPSALSADEANVIFAAAKEKAREALKDNV